MSKIITIIGLLIATMTLSGCNSADENGQIRFSKDCDGGICNRWSYIQELPDGRSVVCAAANDALSCDWDNAK